MTTPTVHCVLPASQGEGTGPQSMNVTLTPTDAAPGTQVHAVVTLGNSPVNSTQTLSNIPTTPSIQLAMSGGATGTVTVTGPTIPISTTSGQPVPIPTYEGDFLLPANAQGAVNFTPLRTDTATVVIGSTFHTICDVTSGATSIGTINVQGPGSAQPTLTAPIGTVRPGYVLNFAGLGWPTGQTPSVTVCPTGGGACVVNPVSNSSLAISAQGQLSGTAKLATTGIPDGNYTVTVTAGVKQASSAITRAGVRCRRRVSATRRRRRRTGRSGPWCRSTATGSARTPASLSSLWTATGTTWGRSTSSTPPRTAP
ncbi:hypothetical protein ACU686_06095 [Yinghuangia aomiensis]